MATAPPSPGLWLRFLRWLRLAPPAPPRRRALPTRKSEPSPHLERPPVAPVEVWSAPQPTRGLEVTELRLALREAIRSERSTVAAQAGPEADADLLFLDRLAHTLESEDLHLPVFPEVSLELDRLLRASDPPQKKVVDIVTQEADLVRRLWQAANSAVYRVPVADLDRAIARIGYDEVWRVGMAACLQGDVFRAGVHHERVVRLRSTGVVSGGVASWLDRSPRGEAYLAGLLHAAGAMFILKHAALPKRRAPSAACLDRVLHRHQASMAVLMVRTWGLGRRVAAGVGYYAAPELAPKEDRAFAAAIRAAVVAAHVGRDVETSGRETARGVLEAFVDPAFDLDGLLKRAERAWRADRPGEGWDGAVPMGLAQSA